MTINPKGISENDVDQLLALCVRITGGRAVELDYSEYGSADSILLVQTLLQRRGYKRHYQDLDTEFWSVKNN